MANHRHTNERLNDERSERQIENAVIPIIEEEATVDKKIVETGKVRISKRISEREKIVDEPLLQEEVSVERVAVNEFVESVPEIRREADTIIIPVVEERVILQKRLVLVEELHVKKQVIEAHKPQRVTLLKEEVDVKRLNEIENYNE